MRVSTQTKEATKREILKVAEHLFAEHGFDRTTTRDLAQAAGIASGTLFNYFPTKEAIVACLASEASAQAIAEANARAGTAATLEEGLFVLVSVALRKLKHLRQYLPALLETALSPIAVRSDDEYGSMRSGHLEAVASIAAKHGPGPLSATALQLYWTLYIGVLAFWANDPSPKQEDTLALIDDSLNMYVAWLGGQSRAERPKRNS